MVGWPGADQDRLLAGSPDTRAGRAAPLFRRDMAKDAELALGHENAVLRRQVDRLRYEPADRVWFAALARAHPPQALDRHLPRHASDAPDLAPETGREQVRHEQQA